MPVLFQHVSVLDPRSPSFFLSLVTTITIDIDAVPFHLSVGDC